MNYRVFLLMITSTISFACINTIVKFMDGYHPYQLVFFRSIGSLIICYFQIRSAGISIWGNNKKILIARGIAGVIALVLFFFVLQKVSFATAITLQYLSPIFTSLIGVKMLKEKVVPLQWISLIICFLGVVLLSLGDLELDLFYLSIGLISAGLSGLAYNLVRISRKTDHHLLSVFYFPLIALPVSGIGSIPYWKTPEGWEWLLIALLGILTQIGQVCMTKALQSAKVASVTVYNYLGSIVSILIGLYVFNEVPTYLMLGGIVTILLGVILFFTLKSKKVATV